MSSEMLSAALDGELRPDELDGLLAEIERSPQLKQQWSRMSLARDALGGAQVRADRPCIAAAVMAGVGAEAPSEKVVPLVPKNRVSGRIAWRPVIGFATAASVASIAFVLGYRSPSVPPVVATAKAPASLVATPAVREMAVVEPVRAVPVAARSTAESQQEWDGRSLNTYLMDYSSYRAGAGMADTLGYARFAAHTAEYNADH
jgi:negative regulator of sigma E activity